MRYVTEFKELETLRVRAVREIEITLLSIKNGKAFVEISGAMHTFRMHVHKIKKPAAENLTREWVL
jgi:hypothetical protein